jgi:hypothetical protein
MTDKHTRRELLRSTGIASASFAIVPLKSSAESEPPTVETEEIPYDVSIRNNTEEKRPVLLTVRSPDGGEELFSKQYSLQGLNNPEKRPDERAKFKGKVAVSARGEYRVEASLPGGTSDATTVSVSADGFAPSQAVNIYVHPSGTVTAHTVM